MIQRDARTARVSGLMMFEVKGLDITEGLEVVELARSSRQGVWHEGHSCRRKRGRRYRLASVCLLDSGGYVGSYVVAYAC